MWWLQSAEVPLLEYEMKDYVASCSKDKHMFLKPKEGFALEAYWKVRSWHDMTGNSVIQISEQLTNLVSQFVLGHQFVQWFLTNTSMLYILE